MAQVFFPQRPTTHPMIYAYEDTNPQYKGLLKVGYTTVDVDRRVAQQYPTKRPDGSVPYRIVLRESAMYPDGSSFDDHDVHRVLERKGVQRVGGEWFRCTVQEVLAAIVTVRSRTENVENRTQTFSMRPEQAEAINRTMAYYRSAYEEGSNRTPKFLWNAKMRFGKTFASYELAKKMGFTRVLILTFKPAVQTAWREDLMTHVDFEGWQFISRDANNLQDTINDQYQRADKNRPIVCFGSFQDFLGVNKDTGGIKTNNEWVHTTNWDLVIFDEYHFGAWKENARKLFEQDEDDYDEDLSKYSTVLSRQDYDMMAGQLVISEVAEAPKPEDLPTIPAFSEAAEEEEKHIPTAVERKPAQLSERKAIAVPNGPSPRKTPTYQPAYTPPTLSIAYKAKTTAVDTSHIGPGSMVTHKAFGTGKVTAIEKGVITVSFDGLEKKFQFPGAFQQGFLRETR